MLSRLMTPKEQLLVLVLTAAIGIGAVSLYIHDRSAHESPGTPAPAPEAVSTRPETPLIDPNSASTRELEALPGIGPALAAEIVAFRARSPFRSVEDIVNVRGIGPKKLEAIRAFVTVVPSAPSGQARRHEE